MTPEARSLALVAVIAIAPLAIVILVALLRGYSIEVHLKRQDRSSDR